MNINEVTRFFKFLNRSEQAVFTCAFMLSDGSSILPGFGCFYAQIGELEAWKNKTSGCGESTLHTTVNETTLSGRRTEHIKSARVLLLDLDRETSAEELKKFIEDYHSECIVESSPGRYHIYWKVMPTIPIDRWSQYQIGLAEHFKGDKNMSHPTAMIRVPGCMRKCKDGKLFMPRIHYLASDLHNGMVSELSEKGLLVLFPDIGTWAAKGLENQKKERQKISELARKAWKSKNGEEKSKALGLMPEAGRNTSLYLAVKEEAWRLELEPIMVFELGMRLNSYFATPLPDSEVNHICRKVINKVEAAREAVRERDRQAIAVLGTEVCGSVCWGISCESETSITTEAAQEEPAEPKTNGVPNKNGHTKIANLKEKLSALEEDLNYKERGIDVPVAQELLVHAEEVAGDSDNRPKKNDIPKSVWDAGALLGQKIWRQEGEAAIQNFIAARTLKQYTMFAAYMCHKWNMVGNFKVSGPVVFLEGNNRWGETVYYGKRLDRDLFQSVINHAVCELTACAKMYGSEELKKDLGKPPTQTQLAVIEKLVWPIAASFKPVARQDSDIIVFQNGVFNLNTGTFTEDLEAPLKYSHPVWCKFDIELQKAYLQGASIETMVPVFARYMNDWFPGDTVILRSILRYFGYAMTTDYKRQAFGYFYGPTRAGKGSICRTMCAILGDQNYASADYAVLDGTFKTAELHDKLLITIEEAEGTLKEHERRMGYLKKLMGGERICFERKYGQPFEDSLIGKMVFQANEPPMYQDKGHAIRSRMICVGFENSFEVTETWVDPVVEILATDANKLGTLMAIAWGRGRADSKPFTLAGSRALEVGAKEVGESIDLLGSVLRKYCVLDLDARTTMGTLTDALMIAYACHGWDQSKQTLGRLDIALRREMQAEFPEAKVTKHVLVSKKEYRGYIGIRFEYEKFIEDYQEIIGIERPALLQKLNDIRISCQ